jgi:hypothetical protein
MPPSPLLLHMHLPKTAGITLFDILDLKYGFRRGLVALNHHAEIAAIVAREAEIHAVSGHFPYGVDTLFDRTCAYIVLLRDPVDRLISNFHYIRREAGHPQQAQFAAMSFDEFARSDDLDLDNAQTRRLLPVI